MNETLQEKENNAQLIQKTLDAGFMYLRFPDELESIYLDVRNAQLFGSMRITAIVCVLFYCLFAISDWFLPVDVTGQLLFVRFGITVPFLIFLGLFSLVPFFQQRIHYLINFGLLVVGWSLLGMMAVLPEPWSYLYYMGFIPVSMMAFILVRYSLKSVSVIIWTLYLSLVLFVFIHDFHPVSPQVDQITGVVTVLFLIFWALVNLVGMYLAYIVEYNVRSDFLKSRLLEWESEQLRIMSGQLQRLSTTDTLTNLANRRHFNDAFDEAWRRAIRHQGMLNLLMVDVDKFKAFNDTYGHQAGDRCLAQIAQVLKDMTQRAGELAARYGGEEFVLILPGIDQASAQATAERIRQQVQSLNIPHSGSKQQVVTLCIGHAYIKPDVEMSAESALNYADKLLYQAKEQGRNQVCSAAYREE